MLAGVGTEKKEPLTSNVRVDTCHASSLSIAYKICAKITCTDKTGILYRVEDFSSISWICHRFLVKYVDSET